MDALRLSELTTDERGRVALVDGDDVLCFDELGHRADALGEAVLSGLERARGVAFTAHAHVGTVLLVAACLERGVPFVPLHPRFGEAERRSALTAAGEPLLLDDDRIEEALARADRGASRRPASPLGSGAQVDAVFEPSNLAVTLLTSGTTGSPRAVEHVRAALGASARAHARNVPFLPGDRWLVAMPLAHAGGLSVVTRSIVARSAIVLHPRFDPDAVLAAIERQGVTLCSVVPTMLRAMLDHDRHGALRRLRAILVGGAAFPADLREECRSRQLPTLATYGLTETCSQIATESPLDPKLEGDKHSGRPLAGAEIRVVDEEEREVAPCAVGRIVVRGPMRMRGYRGLPLPPDQWLDTRDAGYFDEQGRLVVLGRVDDTIVTGGENVHPSEVEDALRAAGFVDALVFGVDDARWGAVVAAIVVARADEQESAAVLERRLSAASAQLASFKRPRLVRRVSALPIGPTGKLDRRAAKARFAAELEPISTIAAR